ncbi:ribosome-associated protein [Pirellulimonas nuda]|uniref:Ribosome-associated protein n=1 Tax=Pirellulimonas nuda TaxID=2528009 RepID=A0A518DCP0_9BACT|nr:RNA-binding S4 domain-containing protein [Pirellulimonas nuda]QDU89247.1 ribosome-associated protein [Pirellulimonas nuda]
MTHPNQTTIHLDQFLKAQGLVATGGQAKLVIQGGEVLVNGELETRRRRQLRQGDAVAYGAEEMVVQFDDDEETT